jgi:hypothetical protein
MKIMRGRLSIGRGILAHLFVGFVVLGILFLLWIGKLESKEIVVALLSLVGTVAGALLAFRLNEDREEAKEERRRKAALVRALFVLIEQEAALSGLWRDHLQGWAARPDRGFNLPALRPPDYSSLRQDVGELQFLLEEKTATSAGNTVLNVLREDRSFHQVLSAINLRSDFHINTLQPKIEARGLQGRAFGLEESKRELGDLIWDRATNETSVVYELIEESLRLLPEVQAELHSLAKEIYPESVFVKTDRS